MLINVTMCWPLNYSVILISIDPTIHDHKYAMMMISCLYSEYITAIFACVCMRILCVSVYVCVMYTCRCMCYGMFLLPNSMLSPVIKRA